jgi:RNA polymerase sigma-70 factor (ECF subfamily)
MATLTFPISLLKSTPVPAFQPPQTGRRQSDAVCRAQAGDQDAFSELYVLHKKHVFSICLRMVREFSLAEDLTQETFLLLHRKISLFRGDSLFRTWLHRMTVNTVLMHLRKNALAAVSLDQLMENVPEEHAGRNFGTRDLAQAGAIDRLTIYRAVATLAPGYRNIFILHDVHGYDHNEIASMLECTCGNTKSQLHKARRALRGTLMPMAKLDRDSQAGQAADIALLRSKTRRATQAARPLAAVALRA